MKTLLPKILPGVALMLATHGIASATPSVSGNTLTWPDDGWYQVQRADSYETVCEGVVSATSSLTGSACVIDTSPHIVINHSTGERFEGLTAGNVLNAVSTVVVEGGRISWPDDGWYQVQNSDTYETVCEGGQRCDVAAGSYIVINHSTGQRFLDVRVESESQGGASTGGVTIAGQTLSWPDDGWYQVQDASSYSTVCEGGVNCTVEPGTYIVINHTTGERFTNLTVNATNAVDNGVVDETETSAGNEPAAGSSDSNRPTSIVVEGNTIRWPDDGWYQVQKDGGFTLYCQGGSECRVAPGVYEVINLTTGDESIVSVAIDSIRVNFAITVPAVVSDALQVRVTWGDRDISATWNRNEFWTVSDYFPKDSENRLSVVFSDQNGALTLGSFEETFVTDSGSSQLLQVTAEQFDTARWDTDGDGVSNLDEAIAGSSPLSNTTISELAGLELRESPSVNDIGVIGRVSQYFEASIPKERPYYLATEDIRPLIIDSINSGLYSDVVTIDIDQSGTGSFSDIFANSYPGDADRESQSGTRTNTGSSIIWQGIYRRSNRSSGVYFDVDFTTGFSVIDEQTRSLTGVIERDSLSSSYSARHDNISYSLIGKTRDDSSFCDPVAGNILNDASGVITTITKSVDDQYWKVTITDRRGETMEEYFADSLALGFYCEYGDFL